MLPVEYRVKGEPLELPPGIDVSAYRVVQEALAGAHDGRPARVEVRWGRDAIELEISGDGVGLDGGGGVAALRERVELCGGRLDGRAQPGGGYVVRARLPVQEAVAAT